MCEVDDRFLLREETTEDSEVFSGLQADLIVVVFTQENQVERPKGTGHALSVIGCV